MTSLHCRSRPGTALTLCLGPPGSRSEQPSFSTFRAPTSSASRTTHVACRASTTGVCPSSSWRTRYSKQLLQTEHAHPVPREQGTVNIPVLNGHLFEGIITHEFYGQKFLISVQFVVILLLKTSSGVKDWPKQQHIFIKLSIR